MRRRFLLTLSGLQQADVCPGSVVLPRFGSVGTKAAVGSAVHEYNALLGEQGREAADAAADDIADFWGLAAKDRAIYFAKCRSLDLQIPDGAQYEVPLCMRADGTVQPVTGGHGEYDAPDDAIVAGTLDILFATPEPLLDDRWCSPDSVLWAPDLKTGDDAYVPPIAYNWQARVAALLGARWTGAEAVVPAIVYPGPGGGAWDVNRKHGKPAPLRAEELAKVEADLRALHARVSEQADNVEQGKLPRLVTGAHCTYCSARPACPAHVAEARALVTGDLALLAAPMTMEQIVRGAGIVGPARAALEKLDDMCRLHVNLQGPIPLAGGRVFGPRASEKQVFHTRETYQAIREEIDPLVGEAEGARLTDAAFGTSRDAIYDVLREAHKAAGIKGKMKEAYERITSKQGVVSTVPAEKWGAHYPKETE